MNKNEAYPAVVAAGVNVTSDNDLCELVRLGCGNQVAELLEARLKEAAPFKAHSEIIGRIQDALREAACAMDEAGNLLEEMTDAG